jgi:hypothetical protein
MSEEETGENARKEPMSQNPKLHAALIFVKTQQKGKRP